MSDEEKEKGYELDQLKVGDFLTIGGDGFEADALVIEDGAWPGCVFSDQDEVKFIVQLLGTVGYRPEEKTLTCHFDPRLVPKRGMLAFLDTSREGVEIEMKSFTRLEIWRAGEVIFKDS